MAKPSSAADDKNPSAGLQESLIDLRDPTVAAVLAWLVPGLGHWYQRRRSKAVLLFVCIMVTFGYGLYLGEGRVVYASFRVAQPQGGEPPTDDRRLPFLCQIGVGLPSLPAVVQAYRFRNPQVRQAAEARLAEERAGLWDWFMVPPSLQQRPDLINAPKAQRSDWPDEVDSIQKRLNRRFELGTVYTMIAGLLNVLAIFDAWGGPAYGVRIEPPRKKKEEGTELPGTQPIAGTSKLPEPQKTADTPA